MQTITLDQKGATNEAIQNMALLISQGDNFEWAFEGGPYMCDTAQQEDEYTSLAAKWKAGLLKVEVKKMIEEAGKIVGWKTILI